MAGQRLRSHIGRSQQTAEIATYGIVRLPMWTDSKGRTSPRDRSGACEGSRIRGLRGSGYPYETERLRNRREAILRRLFEKAAGALRGNAEDAIPCARILSERQLWQPGTIRRDSARYESLVELCLTRGCSLEDAKELVQEAHLRLFMYQRSVMVRDPDSLLRRIAINLSINHYHRELSKALLFEDIYHLDRQGILIDSRPGPERTLAAEQQLDRVVDLVSAMSPRTCQIFIAQRGGYSYEEVAAAFAIKPRTVEKHVATATCTLSELMPTNFVRGAQLRYSRRLDSVAAIPEIRRTAIPRHPSGAPRPGYRGPHIRDEAFSRSS